MAGLQLDNTQDVVTELSARAVHTLKSPFIAAPDSPLG
jgi:hypothetical protein